jgi:hypothetical protein
LSGGRVRLVRLCDQGSTRAAASLGSANRYVTVILLWETPQHSTVSARILSTKASTIRRLSSGDTGLPNLFRSARDPSGGKRRGNPPHFCRRPEARDSQYAAWASHSILSGIRFYSAESRFRRFGESPGRGETDPRSGTWRADRAPSFIQPGHSRTISAFSRR